MAPFTTTWLANSAVFFFFFYLHRSPLVSPPGVSVCPLPPPMSPRRLRAVLAPFWGGWGRRGWGGGGRPRCPSSGVSTSQARRRQEARHLSLCRGGGGASRVAPVIALPTLRSLPRCPPRWGLHGACFLRARSCGPSRTLSPLPPHLAALSSGGGGRCPPLPTFTPHPWGGGGVCGGGGGLVVFPSLHACRRHDASTAQA